MQFNSTSDEVQRVYRSQGVEIADKHVEVIVRQMTQKVKIDESGDTKLLPGELAEQHTADIENAEVESVWSTKPRFIQILSCITKASLNTRQLYLSGEPSRKPLRVLTEAAVEGKKDLLRSSKENVIIGRLIPGRHKRIRIA
ncbi:MAG: hypothetical protein MZU97_02280 [Bacillus subtilis]|nr:hypothetical protein [Bacillus subtilis]